MLINEQYLILGGGLSHNDYVRMRMRKAFGSSMKIRYVTAEQVRLFLSQCTFINTALVRVMSQKVQC
jgi:hypothetical protein